MEKDIQIYLGRSETNRVYWKPKKQRNQHFVVVGTSGSGKTETLKAIIFELQKFGVPSLIVDFHNEYGDIAGYRVNLRECTINPLEVLKGRRPQDVIYEVANIMKKIFKLGDQQEAFLRLAIKKCYSDKGIDILTEMKDKEAPRFLDIKDQLEFMITPQNRGIIRTLLNRIDPLFEVDIFFGESTVLPFEKVLEKTTSIELKDFPTEDVKSAIAEFFLNKFIYYLYSAGRTDKLRLYCIVDEAHRLLYDNSPLDRLLREARKYGAGIILSSQRPSDFSETILANAGGILSLQCNLEGDAKFMAKQMGIDYKDILNLNESGLAYLKLTAETETYKVKIERIAERTGQKPAVAQKTEERPSQPPPAPRKRGNGFTKDMEILRHSVERKNMEIKEYLEEIKSLYEQKRKVEKELENVKGKKGKRPQKGKACDHCTFINDSDATYCNDCGRKL